jgi:colanic acid biosynthesis glycosyl transferase WcaI
MPSKLTGILASSRPVIAGANPGSEVYNVLKDHGCGIVVEPEDPKQMSEAVIALYRDRALADEYGKKGRVYAVQHLSKGVILKKFKDGVIQVIRLKAEGCSESGE